MGPPTSATLIRPDQPLFVLAGFLSALNALSIGPPIRGCLI
jgi:hypothetical protein